MRGSSRARRTDHAGSVGTCSQFTRRPKTVLHIVGSTIRTPSNIQFHLNPAQRGFFPCPIPRKRPANARTARPFTEPRESAANSSARAIFPSAGARITVRRQPKAPIDLFCPLCHICIMTEGKASLNLRAIPISVIRRAKAAAALEGKTLRMWVVEAIQEKIRKAK